MRKMCCGGVLEHRCLPPDDCSMGQDGDEKKMVAFVGWQELKKLTFSMNDALSRERDKRIFNDLQ